MTIAGVLLDGRPCASRTGIGRYARTVVRALSSSDTTNRYSVLSWRSEAAGLQASLATQHCAVRSLIPGRFFASLEQMGVSIPNWILGRPGIVHGTSFSVPRVSGARTIATLHDTAYKRMPATYAAGIAEGFDRCVQRVLRYTDHIVTDSNHAKGELISAYGIDADDVTVVYHASTGLASNVTHKDDRAPGSPAEPFLLFVGELGPRKNLIRLIQAFARAAPDIPHALVLAGPDGTVAGYSTSLRAEAVALGIADRVRFTGWLPDDELSDMYASCAALVYPSLYEGFGCPLVEAMTHGKPILTSNVSSMPEVASEAAIFVNPLSVDEITEAILALVRDEGLARRLAAMGRRRAARFTTQAMVEAFCGLYDNLAARN